MSKRERRPTHPGKILKDIVLNSIDINSIILASKLNIPHEVLQSVLNEQLAITPEIAEKLGDFCGNGPNFWLRMQKAYDSFKPNIGRK